MLFDVQVLAYLKAENQYCDAVMADTQKLRTELFTEMKGRIQEEDSSVPVRDAGYYYYTRTLEGKQYGVHCRRKIVPREGEVVDESTKMDTRSVCTTRSNLRDLWPGDAPDAATRCQYKLLCI